MPKKQSQLTERYAMNQIYYMEKGRRYYQDNRERVLTRMKNKIYCPICKNEYVLSNKYAHLSTAKHMNNVRLSMVNKHIDVVEESHTHPAGECTPNVEHETSGEHPPQ